MNDTFSRFFQKEKRLLSYRCVELLLAVIFIDASLIWCDVPQAFHLQSRTVEKEEEINFSPPHQLQCICCWSWQAPKRRITHLTHIPFITSGPGGKKRQKKKGTRITQLIHIPFITSCCGENKFTEKKGKIIVCFTHIPLIISFSWE